MASFQDNLSKQGPEYQTILDFTVTRNDAGGSHGNWNFKACQVPVKSPLPTYQLRLYRIGVESIRPNTNNE